MRRTARSHLGGIVAALGLLALVAGVPIALVTLVGWPLPDHIPSWERVRIAIQQGDIPANAVVRFLAVVSWLVWAQLAWATAWEVAVNMRRVARGENLRPGPLVAPAVHLGIGRLVGLALSISIATSTSPAVALAPNTSQVVATEPLPSPPLAPAAAPATASDSATPVTTDRCWVVQHGDTLWRIAERALGDGARASEILDLNTFLQSPRHLRPGQHLQLPADAAIPAERRSEPVPSAETVSYLAPAEVVIEPGDNLWTIAAGRLTIALGTPPPDHAILDHVHEVIDLNADIVEDPNLIYPGEVFTLPAVGDPPPPPAPPPPPPVVVEPHDPPVMNSATTAPTTTERPAATPPTVAAPHEVPLPAAVPATDVAPASTAPVQPQVPETSSTNAHDTDRTLPTIAGITGALALSSGLLLTYRRRRARRAAVGSHALRHTAADNELERALVAVADVPLLVWANHELAEAFSTLPRIVNATPVAVELSTEHGIEILWSEPNPHAPHPWEATGQGWAWRLIYDPDQPIPAQPVAPPLPGLVTIGTRDGRQLLVDLEAFPTLHIDGPNEQTHDLLRSILTELATNQITTDTYVELDIDVDGLANEPRLARSDRQLADVVAGVVDAHAAVVTSAGLSTTFQLRAHDPAGRELVVIVTDELDQRLAERAQPHHGIAIMATAAADTTPAATIHLAADGAARLDPLGIVFSPAALPVATSNRVADFLEEATALEPDAAQPAGETANDGAADVEPVQPIITSDVDSEDCDVPQPPPVMVRVLGAPEVAGFPQLGRLETSIVAFLACRGGSATHDQLVDAVWNGRLVERATVWNRLSKTRRQLGEEHLPPRAQGSDHITLGPAVGTDLAYFHSLVSRAETTSTGEAIEILTTALDLVRGVPFDAPNYDWAHQHQYHAEACELIESTGLRLADSGLDVGDLTTARHAIAQALRALPANEPLFRMRMRIEATANNLTGVRNAYEELTMTLDAWGDGEAIEPSAQTRQFFARLTADRSHRSVV